MIVETRIGGGVGTRSASDGRLVDADDSIEMLPAYQLFEPSSLRPRPVQALSSGAVKNIHDQTALAGAGHAGDAGHGTHRDLQREVFQVVLARAFDHDEITRAFAPL